MDMAGLTPGWVSVTRESRVMVQAGGHQHQRIWLSCRTPQADTPVRRERPLQMPIGEQACQSDSHQREARRFRNWKVIVLDDVTAHEFTACRISIVGKI